MQRCVNFTYDDYIRCNIAVDQNFRTPMTLKNGAPSGFGKVNVPFASGAVSSTGAVRPYDESNAFQTTQFHVAPSVVNSAASVSFVLPTDALLASATCESKTTVLPTVAGVDWLSRLDSNQD